MRASIPKILLCAATMIFASVSIAVTEERTQLKMRFAEAWKSDALVQVIAKTCGKNSPNFDPKAAYRTDPQSFGGVSPESNYWPEVESAYSKFQSRICAHMSAKDLLGLYAELMTAAMSDDELRQSIAFFSSPAGKRIVAASANAEKELMLRAGDKLQKLAAELWSETRLEVVAIAEKYKKNPR